MRHPAAISRVLLAALAAGGLGAVLGPATRVAAQSAPGSAVRSAGAEGGDPAPPSQDSPPSEDEPPAREAAPPAEPGASRAPARTGRAAETGPAAPSPGPGAPHAAAPEATEDDGPLLADDDILADLAPIDPDERVDPDSVTVREVVATEDELAIPEVVVSGARVEQAADNVAVSTEVIRRQEIEESGARDAAELLEERSGLQVQRSFRGTELWLRGMDPAYTLVLVDGDRVPGRVGGAVDLSRYGVENLERVEIVRGPSSALYGADAIGGVVNLITRDSDRDFEADALFSYGMNHVVDGTARVAGRPTEWLHLRLLGGMHYAAAFQTETSEGEATAGSERIQWSTGARVDIRPDDRHRVRAQAEYMQLTLNGVDGGAGGAVFDRTQLQEQMRATLEHTLRGPDGLRLVTRLSYNQFREQYLLDQRGAQQLDRYEDNREHMGQLTSLVRFTGNALGHHSVTVGFEQLFQSLDSERLTAMGRRTRLGLFAQDEWVPWEDGDASLTIVPGVRFDADSQFGEQLSPKLAMRFDPVEQLVIRASYGRGFRAPSFQQLLLRFENPTVGYVVNGNTELGAESAHGVDAGIEWSPIEQLRFSAAFFRNDIEDMIAVVSGGADGAGTQFGYDNLSSAWTMGLESTASLRVDDALGVVAGYTLTSTWDGENERQLEGRALHRVTLATRLAYEPWEVAFVARGALMMDRVFYRDLDADGVDDELYADPLAQVDLRLSKRFDRHLELFVGVDNLLSAGDEYSLLRPFTFYGGARGRY